MFWKAAAIIVLTVILSTAIGKTEKDFGIVLTITACCGIACLALQSLSDVIVFLWNLSSLSEYLTPYISIILKIVGVAVITEMTALVSLDAGCHSLEKAMQFLGTSTILSLSLPLFEHFIDIVQEILNIV